MFLSFVVREEENNKKHKNKDNILSPSYFLSQSLAFGAFETFFFIYFPSVFLLFLYVLCVCLLCLYLSVFFCYFYIHLLTVITVSLSLLSPLRLRNLSHNKFSLFYFNIHIFFLLTSFYIPDAVPFHHHHFD